jgi:hypothetical protein
MDQKSICLSFARKGFKVVAIHKELAATLGAEAVSYPSVTGDIRDARLSPYTHPVTFSEPDPAHDDSNEAILLALAEQPFASVRQLAGLAHLPRSTDHRRLTQSLSFRVRHLRWVPHILSASQELARVTHSRDLLRVLQRQQSRSWHDIVTLDESWFYLHTDHEFI